MEFKQRTIKEIADMICGNFKEEASFFRYRSSSYLTEFFQDCGTFYRHDGSTRNQWVAEVVRQILAEPHAGANTPPHTLVRVISTLMDPGDAVNEGPERPGALALLNTALAREGDRPELTVDASHGEGRCAAIGESKRLFARIGNDKRACVSVSMEYRVDRRSCERGDCQFRHGAVLELLHLWPVGKDGMTSTFPGKNASVPA